MRDTTLPDTQECEWILTHEEKNAFEEIKDAVSKAPVLEYFSEIDLTENQGDACKDALAFFRCSMVNQSHL